jgi:hypothetical protein
MNGIENQKQSAVKIDESSRQKQLYRAPVAETQEREKGRKVEEVETTSKANNAIYRETR